ncbi:MAG: autotransporter domain-containing protein, partial [Campylobacter sp.]|nr:autotransporter domain-containing protein [Campylobacter sp.]
VKSEYGETAVYYSLDTQGNNAEFSNDISQRKWEANTHNSKADNLPTKLDNLNVGLIKTGAGILTLSGTNTYEGATVIDGGEIKLRSVNTKTAQIAGNVYVNNGSTLSGDGIIKKDLTNNNSIVRPGNADLTDLTVEGTYTQKGTNSKLILDFGNDKNSKLIAQDYNIQTGELEYNPLQQYFTVDKEVKIELGKLTDHISKFDEVLVASNNSIKFNVKLDTDKTTINKDPNKMPIQPNTGEQDNDTTPPAPTIGEASIGSGATSGGSLGDGSDISNGGVSSKDNSNPNGGDSGNLVGSSSGGASQGGDSSTNLSGKDSSGANLSSNQGSQGGSNLTPNNTGTNNTQSGQNGAKSPSSPATESTNPNPSSGGSSGLSSSTSSQTNPSTSSTQNTSSPNTQNSQTSKNTQGDTGDNQPTQPNQDSNQGSNPSNTLATNKNNSDLNTDINSQTPNQNNNTQGNKKPNNNGTIIVTPVVRSDAYASNSAQLSQTMRSIRGKEDLNPQYQQFFATLDSSTQENYKSIMSRIEGRSIGDMTSIQSSTHNNFMQNNMLFSLNPATSTLFAYNQNPYDNGVLVASVASDYIIDLGLNSATPKDYWYINPTYKRYNGDDFDGYQSGASVNLAQHIGSSGLIAYGIGASLSKLDFDIGATAKSSNFDIALNYTHDFESFKLLSGGSFMISFNENERTVANTLNSDYKSYSSSLQLGVAKDFRHYSIVVTPLGYLGYGKIYQESFKESGGIFAKNYDSINHDLYTVGVGLNLAYEGSDEKSRYTGYIIYERMLDGYNMDASAEFNDFKGQKFSQRYHLDKNRLNLGVGAEYAFNSGYFAKFGIGSEFATTSDNYNLSVTFGKRF